MQQEKKETEHQTILDKDPVMDAELAKEKKILVDDLRRAGINVNSVYDLVDSKASLRAAIPVLIKHLRIKHHPRIKEEIIGVLRKYKGPMMAADSQTILDNDPEYQAMMRAKEAEWAALKARLDREEKPLVDDLRKAGVVVNSVYDLVNSKESFPAAIPVLLKHLRIKYDHRIKQGIIMALIDPASVIGFKEIYEEFCNNPAASEEEDHVNFQMKWSLGSALAEASRIETLPIVLELLRDKRHGRGRENLIYAVKRLPKKKRNVLLRQLSQDPDLSEIIKKAKLKFS